MDNLIEVVQVPKEMFLRLYETLISVEKILKERQEQESAWLSEETALRLLGCSKRTLVRLKAQGKIAYKAVGKKHQYGRKSIEKHNSLMSTL